MPNSSEMNFAGRLVQRLGETSCLIDAAKGQTITGRELPGLIVGFAAGFLSAGLRPGRSDLLGCGLSPASTLAYLGAMYAGVVPVPVEERLLTSSGDSLLATSQAKAVWTARGVSCDWVRGNRTLVIDGNFPAQSAESLPANPCAEDDVAALMPTSGTTGVPRLVMVSHGNLIANTQAIIRSQHLGTNERAMLVMPISYCFGASVMHTHLYQGGGVVFDSRFMFPDRVLQAIDTYGCTTFAGVPIIYNVLLRRSNLRNIPLPGLRRFLQAGGALAAENVREMREIVPAAEFFVMYGQTEATARISRLPSARLKPTNWAVPGFLSTISRFALWMRKEGNCRWGRLAKFRCAGHRYAWDIWMIRNRRNASSAADGSGRAISLVWTRTGTCGSKGARMISSRFVGSASAWGKSRPRSERWQA